MKLRRIDLNLLVVFDVLMQERNITRSAAKLAMSQPAVSHALNRLREQMHDPLLVRSGDRMQASPRALILHQELHQALMQIEHTLSPRLPFDPGASQRQFTIAATDYVEALVLPPLLECLQNQAPDISLNIQHLRPSALPIEDIDQGSVDIAICYTEQSPKRIETQLLLEDDYLCAMSNTHPLAGKTLTLARFLQQEHLLVSPEAKRKQIVAEIFSDAEQAPKVRANLPHFLVALHVVSSSNLLVTGPARFLRKLQKPFALHLTPPPFDISPFQISLAWHQLHNADPGLTWLRQQLNHIAENTLNNENAT